MTERLTIPVLTRHCSETLLQMARTNQGDPLGYQAFGGEMEDMDCETGQINFMDELATDALTGGQPGVVRRLMEWPTLRTMDAVTAALLRHMGVLPECALALSDALGKSRQPVEIGDGDEDCGIVRIHGDERNWAVQMDYGRIAWNSLGMVILPAIPVTAASAAAGRPLRDLFSHPVLDRFDLLIDRGRRHLHLRDRHAGPGRGPASRGPGGRETVGRREDPSAGT
jgi:hypothetical protein